MNVEEYKAVKKPKYRNKKTVVDGITFDSMREARHWCRLKLMEKAGEITGLRRQVIFEIIPPCKLDGRRRPSTKYISDFVYYDADGNQVVADAKGCKTPEYQIKRKLMATVHGIEVLEL
jgi:hypothetical protein